MPEAEFRFYEELNDFLPSELRRQTFSRDFAGRPTVKDTIESIGVPHTEIDLILVDGVSVDFDYHICGGERIAVYPVFEGIDISNVTRLRPRPLRRPRFLVDANLGRLARILRLLGFDCLYDQDLHDEELADLAMVDGLTILTRDRWLLMRRIVTRGYFVRSQYPRAQAAEVVRRFDLAGDIRMLTRCVHCNGSIGEVPRQKVLDRIPENTRRTYSEFFQCAGCGRVYWRGAHWDSLQALVRGVVAAAVADG